MKKKTMSLILAMAMVGTLGAGATTVYAETDYALTDVDLKGTED